MASSVNSKNAYQKKCPQCQRFNPDRVKYCDNCGHNFEVEQQPGAAKQSHIHVVDASQGGVSASGPDSRAVRVDQGGTYIEKQVVQADKKSWPRWQIVLFLAGSISLVFALLIIVWGLIQANQPVVSPSTSAQMFGEFNIAVAEFDVDQGDFDAETGLAVSQQIYQRIDNSLQELTQNVDVLYEVRGPDQIGKIDGETPDQRADTASRLVHQINADIIIYGVISDNSVKQTILPDMYISERLFSIIPEFLGRHPLGEAILIPSGSGDLVSRVEANRDIAGRAQATAYIATGVSLFNLADYERAFSFFELAMQAEGWES